MTETATPKVTVGVPVHNGAAHLEKALTSLIMQTLPDIEIVISDNASNDGTAEICRRFAEKDARVRVFRQPTLIPVMENFRFVLDQARAPYFMWAAHDDTRQPEIVERLWARLEATPDAVLACGDVVELVHGVPHDRPPKFVTEGMAPWRRMSNAAAEQCFHIYGLWRTEVLRPIPMRTIPWWPDTPIMIAAATKGTFVHVPGVSFFYRFNPRPFFKAGTKPTLRSVMTGTAGLVKLIAQSAATVGSVAGPWRGAQAAWFTTLKVGRQIIDYAVRRM